MNDYQGKFSNLPIEITVCVGKARPNISALLELQESSVLALDRNIEDPVELYIGDRLIARGQLEERTEDDSASLVVRVTEVSVPGGGAA